MKKQIIALSLAVGIVAPANGQGTIKFNNTSSSFLISTNGTLGVNGTTTGVTDKTAGDFYYTLLYDVNVPTSSNPSTGGWTATGLIATNGVIFAGGITGPGGANGIGVSQLAPGSSAYFEVVGWSASLNSMTFTEMELAYNQGPSSGLWDAGYFGVSSPTAGALILGGVGTPATLPPSLFGSAAGIQSGFYLQGVSFIPEPPPIALVALGGVAILARRQKSSQPHQIK